MAHGNMLRLKGCELHVLAQLLRQLRSIACPMIG